MQQLHLEELLPAYWLGALRETIESSPKAQEILGHGRDATIVPSRRNTFKSLQRIPPVAVRVIIIADAPFAAQEKATGIACFDGSRSWDDNISPTLRYVIKSALVSRGHCKRDDSLDAVRATLRRLHLSDPREWFAETIEQGVLWLNASLTRAADNKSVDAHAKFWKPVIGEIVGAIALAKAQLPANHPDRSLCIALWGARAKGLSGTIRQRCLNIPYRVIANQYPPSVQSFLARDNFREINMACDNLRLPRIAWVRDADYVQQLVRRRAREGEPVEDEDEPPARRRRRTPPHLQLTLFWPPCEEAASEQEACVVCMANKINTVILNCGHVAVCATCSTMLQDCPICRAEIRKIVRTFSAR